MSYRPCKNMGDSWTYVAKKNKLVWKGYILYDSIYVTFWKRQIWRGDKQISFAAERVEYVGDIFYSGKYSMWHYNNEYMALCIC